MINKFGIVAALLIITSNYAYALEKTETCNYPHHFTIEGPSNTAILSVETFPNSKITVIQTSSNSFDVTDNSNCESGIRSVKLKVGTDRFHISEKIFVDHTDGSILFIQSDELNFKLVTLDRISATDYKFVYESLN